MEFEIAPHVPCFRRGGRMILGGITDTNILVLNAFLAQRWYRNTRWTLWGVIRDRATQGRATRGLVQR